MVAKFCDYCANIRNEVATHITPKGNNMQLCDSCTRYLSREQLRQMLERWDEKMEGKK